MFFIIVRAPKMNVEAMVQGFLAFYERTVERDLKRAQALASRRLRRGEISYRRIMEFVKAEGVLGKLAVALSDRTAQWLYKVMKLKVWR
jgi:hypothetical protein